MGRLAAENGHFDAIIAKRLDLPDCRQMGLGHEIGQAQQIDAELHCLPLTLDPDAIVRSCLEARTTIVAWHPVSEF
ncbi:hypothetical protein D3C87_2128490 [compost metagenome]